MATRSYVTLYRRCTGRYYVWFVWTLPPRMSSGNKVRDKFSLTDTKNNLCSRRILWLQKTLPFLCIQIGSAD